MKYREHLVFKIVVLFFVILAMTNFVAKSKYKGSLISEEIGQTIGCEQFSVGKSNKKTEIYATIKLNSGIYKRVNVQECIRDKTIILYKHRGIIYFNNVYSTKHT
jgi:hypothetical protein